MWKSAGAADPHTAAPDMVVVVVDYRFPARAFSDLETGATAQVPWKKVAEEALLLKWAFVRKVYFIIALQFGLAAAIVAAACFSTPVQHFLTPNPNLALWLFFTAPLVIGLNAIVLTAINREKRPANLLLLGLVTVCLSLSIAVICSFSTTFGRAVLQYLTLIVAAVIGLILYTLVGATCQLKCTFFPSFMVAFLVLQAVFYYNQTFFHLARMD